MINDSTRKHHIEKLGVDNLTDLDKLYAAVYEKSPPPGYFSRKYDTAYTGVCYTGFMAYNDDKVILSAQSADTMTHPRYRNKGLFVELATLTYQLCREVGIELIFGFPNQNSVHGFINRLGWQMSETMDCFIIPTGLPQWKRFWRKVPVLKNLFNRWQKIPGKYLLRCQPVEVNSVFDSGYTGVYRNYDYLNYKAHPSHQLLKIGRSVLWIKINNELLIGDINILPGDFDYVLVVLKTLARKMGIKEIHFHTSKNTTLHGLFAEHFNPISSFPVIFKEIGTNIQLNGIKFTSADIDTF